MREVSDRIQFVQVVIVILMLWIINLAKKPQLLFHPLYHPPLAHHQQGHQQHHHQLHNHQPQLEELLPQLPPPPKPPPLLSSQKKLNIHMKYLKSNLNMEHPILVIRFSQLLMLFKKLLMMSS